MLMSTMRQAKDIVIRTKALNFISSNARIIAASNQVFLVIHTNGFISWPAVPFSVVFSHKWSQFLQEGAQRAQVFLESWQRNCIFHFHFHFLNIRISLQWLAVWGVSTSVGCTVIFLMLAGYILAEDLHQLDFLATCWPQLKSACISHPIWGVKSVHWS